MYSRELVELLFVQPYCRISNVVDAEIVKRQTAAEYLQKFVSEGILKEIEIGREKYISIQDSCKSYLGTLIKVIQCSIYG
ncbi:hypothetical protein [Legionella tunisiensis]|uniref:hypothetical protein n=1 Tax=Legionella tunisiensis TaxID=1034944 RepID=UPI0038B87949